MNTNFLNSTVAAAVAQASQNVDMSVASSGGGEYTPPAAGKAIATLVGYVELGKHLRKSAQYGDKIVDNVELVFELSGAAWPVKDVNGEKIPDRITVKVTRSLSEKSKLFKLFSKMNHGKSATHIAQLIGQHFLVDITHNESNGTTYANLNIETVAPPVLSNPLTGAQDAVPAPVVYSEPRVFLWDYCNLDMWSSLFIDGEYAERKDDKGKVTHPAKSKNKFQNMIKEAVNFEGSPIHLLLSSQGLSADALPSTNPESVLAAGLAVDQDDPTAGMI